MPNFPYTNDETGLDDMDQPIDGDVYVYELGPCVICSEKVTSENDPAEMHNPDNPEEEGGICHANCGLGKGWVIS